MLFHISEEPDIQVFEPRPSPYTAATVVWAIDAEHLRNYLLPRECPRVTYCAGAVTTMADRQQFLGSSTAVVAIEEAWLDVLSQLERRGVDFRIVPNLWPLRDAVAASSLQFSIIRMRNLRPESPSL